MSKSTDQYLHEHRAWNWQWPVRGNCWATGRKPKKGVPSSKFTPTGPGKRTLAKRAARGKSTKPAYMRWSH